MSGVTPRSSSSLWSSHDENVAATNAARGGNGANREANKIVLLTDYQDLPIVSRDVEPLEWWATKKKDGFLVPFIDLVRKFMCVPATSVASEQLFSAAGELISDRRSRLSSDNVNMLLFLNKNARR